MPIEFSRIKLGNFYDRPTLAAMWGYEGFQAISRGVVTPKGQNLIVLFVTRLKQIALTQYVDFIEDGVLHWEGEDGHRNDQRIAAAEATETAIHLFYRELHHSPFEYKGIVRPLEWVLETQRPSRFRFALELPNPVQNDLMAHEDEIAITP